MTDAVFISKKEKGKKNKIVFIYLDDSGPNLDTSKTDQAMEGTSPKD